MRAPAQAVVVVTGGGAQSISRLLTVPRRFTDGYWRYLFPIPNERSRTFSMNGLARSYR